MSRSSGDDGRTWTEAHLDGPFDAKGAQPDYDNAAGDTVGFAYSRTAIPPQTEPTDIYFVSVAAPATVAATSDGDARQANAAPTAETLALTGGVLNTAGPIALAAATILRAASKRADPDSLHNWPRRTASHPPRLRQNGYGAPCR